MFKDRRDAGRRLALALQSYRGEGVLVLAIPRGGVEVGYEVARHIGADFSILVARKLPFPHNPEAGFGAVAEDGSIFMDEHARGVLGDDTVNAIIEQQKREAARRVAALRSGAPLSEIKGRTVILVDDGIAMGSTMRASVMMLRKGGAGTVVVAAPVAAEHVARDMAGLVDEVVILERPAHFRAVAQVYLDWYDVPDAEVLEIIRKWEDEKARHQGFA